MEIWVYQKGTLDALGIVDRFAELSINWRYNRPGDMTIVVPVITSLILQPEMVIWPQGGREAFVIERTQIIEDEEGDMMTVEARTFSAYLGWRGLPAARYYQGTGARIIKDMMDAVFSDARRTLPRFSYSIDTSLGDPITYEASDAILLDQIENICQASGLGFATEFDPESRTLVFRVYRGVDHTAKASGMPIIFDAEYENICRMNYTDSIRDAANVAYVMGEVNRDTNVRKWLEYDPAAKRGLDRFEVILESGKSSTTDEKDAEGNHIVLTDAQYNQLLRDYGKEKLAMRTRSTEAIGELVTQSKLFAYGVDYALGDIVMVRNQAWGMSLSNRIKEANETFDQGVRTVHLTVGSRLPTLLEKMTRM